ncbi:hypothetical protein [Thalassotalea sediminis]|uniref:hypothetical protein n=1 Tax=Thalassotalea sediminis TaxID=1759089 RepID=UPI002573D73B|nr:hypothetical protein [Thalassotalea sediminis]
MDYSAWIKKTFPVTKTVPQDTIEDYVSVAKASTKLLRESVKVTAFLLVVIPFNLYLNYLTKGTVFGLAYILLSFTSFGVGGFIALYFEQKTIKSRLRKIIKSRYECPPET